MKTTVPISRWALQALSVLLMLYFSSFEAYSQATCAAAATLTPGTTCTNTNGDLRNATATAGMPDCGYGNVNSGDQWYKFVATHSLPTISLSNIGTDLRSNTRGKGTQIQLFSGTCGSLTSIGCAVSTTAATNSYTPTTPLTIGQEYYIRISTNHNSTTYSGTAWKFRICITQPVAPRFGNSYVNISKKTVGGVVEPGDTLEIRMTIHYTSGTLYQPRYVDNLPSHTKMIESPNGFIRIITNEGLPYYTYTTTPGDDAATYVASPGPGEYNIRMNIGFGTTPASAPAANNETNTTGTGRMLGTSRPRGGSGLLFATAFRVVVDGNVGDTITLGTGKFLYSHTNGGTTLSLQTTPYKILISEPLSLCANATGVNYANESGGTFGSGSVLNRSYDLDYTIPGYTRVLPSTTVGTGDGQYSIVNNLSPRSSTNRDAQRTPNCGSTDPFDNCNNRMHGGHWDIDGDHTGTNDAVGNEPPANGTLGGYMLMVNADYVASETFRQTIDNLCPNTYYEFSAWFRNICPTCGMDSLGTSYTPRQPGVLPNLTFSLDGLDRYSTGEMAVEGWVKKGFVFRTGPSQTSATFAIRNNAQGGGGNDWAMDDISIATCLPNMSYSPSLAPTVCEGNALTINDTIRSFFGNYTHFIWQRSADNGSTWSNVGSPGTATPVINENGEYEYVTSYTIPHTATNVSDSGNLYRVLVATTSDNLSSEDCQVTDGVSIINLSVITCGPVLTTDILSFNGRLQGGRAVLNWSTSLEDYPVTYFIEKSLNGTIYEKIGEVQGRLDGSAVNYYQFSETEPLSKRAWYRITVHSNNRQRKHSQVIPLKPDMPEFELVNVINPFKEQLRFEISVATNTALTIELYDNNGGLVRREKQLAFAGVNSLKLDNTGNLAPGVYTLRINNGEGKGVTRRVMTR